MEITLAEFYEQFEQYRADIQAGHKRAVLRLTAESKSTVPVGKAPEIVITGVKQEYGGYTVIGALGVFRGENKVRIETMVAE